MTNKFMKVNKDLFLLKLTPIDLLIIAQVMEFNTNTGDCFISDKALANQFGVSESTVKRSIKKLEEELGFIKRETTNVKGGKERHMKVNLDKLEKEITSVKMSLEEDSKASQGSKCSLTSVKMNFDKEQNDTIKDNLQDKEKDNLGEVEISLASLGLISTSYAAPWEGKNYNELSKSERVEKFRAECGF